MICPKCGHQQIDSAECLNCGVIFARYRPSEVPSGDFSTAELKPPSSWWAKVKRVYRVARWISPVVTVVILLLALRVPDPPEVDTAPDARPQAQAKIAEAQQAVQDGSPYRLTLDEAQVNSILHAEAGMPARKLDLQLAGETAAEEAAQEIQDMRVNLIGDRLHAYVLFKRFGTTLALSLEGRLSVVDGRLRFDVDTGKLGSLPIPRPVLVNAVEEAFNSPENREKLRLPPEVADIRVEGGQIVVDYE